MQFRAIQSDANEKFKRWKKLTKSARAIKKEGVTLAEGAHLAITLFEKGIKPRALIFRASGVTDELSEIVQVWAAEKIPCYVLDNKLYDQISPVEHGAGMICEIRVPQFNLPQKAKTDVLYLDGVQDPGNVGTLIRTAVAAGISCIVASRGSASLWSPKALRAGMGAHFSAKLYENIDPVDLPDLFDATRLAADARGGEDLYQASGWENGHTVWMMGAEGPGLSEVALSQAERRLYIPIIKDCESLNVGAAAAVCLFEQRRRRLSLKPLK